MSFYNEDIANIDLESGTVHRSFLNRAIGSGDNKANRFGVRVFRGNQEVSLNGYECSGYFIRQNRSETVIISPGVVNGNLAYVTLPQACYAYEGAFTLAIKVVGEGITETMRIVDGTVVLTSTDTYVDPGQTIPSLDELLALIAEMEETVDKAVRFDSAQSLTAAQKKTARNNIKALMKKDRTVTFSDFNQIGAPFGGNMPQYQYPFDATYPYYDSPGDSFKGQKIWIRTKIFEVEAGGTIAVSQPVHILRFYSGNVDDYYYHDVVASAGNYTIPSDCNFLAFAMIWDPAGTIPAADTVIATVEARTVRKAELFLDEELCEYYGLPGEERTWNNYGLYAYKSNVVARGVCYPYNGDILYRSNATSSAVIPFAVAANGSYAIRAMCLAVQINPGSNQGKIFMMAGYNENTLPYWQDSFTWNAALASSVNGVRLAISSDNRLIISYMSNDGALHITDASLGSNTADKVYQVAYNCMEHVTGCLVQTGTAPNIAYYGQGFPDYAEFVRFSHDVIDDSTVADHETRITDLENGGGGGGGSSLDWAKGMDLKTFGQEYLGSFYTKLRDGSSFKVLLEGDSTFEYYKGTSDGIDTMVRQNFEKYGYTNGTFINNAVSGSTASDWATGSRITTDIGLAPDLFIIRYGFNNESGDTDAQRAANFYSVMRTALTTIRASLPVSTCSIVLMMPNSSNDDAHNRGLSMKKALEPKVRDLCREFGCGFIDTFRLWYDAGALASNMYDNPFGDGTHVHPNGLQNRNIASVMFDFVCPETFRTVNNGGSSLSNVFKLPDIATPTNILTDGLIGTFTGQDTAVAGLPTAGGYYYRCVCMKDIRFAYLQFSIDSGAITYYMTVKINGTWAAWAKYEAKAAYTLGTQFTTLDSLQNAILTISNALVYTGEEKSIFFQTTASFGLFTSVGGWIGKIQKRAANSCIVEAWNVGGKYVRGFKNDNTWRWDEIPHNAAFLKGLKSTLTNANDTGLVGTYFSSDSAATNLPTSSNGYYYLLAAFGIYQIAARYDSSGLKQTYHREYINDQWYPWKLVNHVAPKETMHLSKTFATGDNFSLEISTLYTIEGIDCSGCVLVPFSYNETWYAYCITAPASSSARTVNVYYRPS